MPPGGGGAGDPTETVLNPKGGGGGGALGGKVEALVEEYNWGFVSTDPLAL